MSQVNKAVVPITCRVITVPREYTIQIHKESQPKSTYKKPYAAASCLLKAREAKAERL